MTKELHRTYAIKYDNEVTLFAVCYSKCRAPQVPRLTDLYLELYANNKLVRVMYVDRVMTRREVMMLYTEWRNRSERAAKGNMS